MAMAHARFGKLPWARLLQPAIRLARGGFIVSPHLIGVKQVFTPRFTGVTNFDRHFGTLAAGQRFRQPLLAATLERLARGGDREFYEGRTADLIVRQMKSGNRPGIITKADLAGYKAVWRTPVTGDWRGFQVVTAAPPSSGGIALMQLLRMEAGEQRRSSKASRSIRRNICISSRRSRSAFFADRAQYLGDPDFFKVPVATLTAPAYLAKRAAEVDPVNPSKLAAVQPGLERPQTTHFSIIDKWGNAVSNTYTINGWFGSGVVVEGGGFLLNDEMDDFSAKPGAPNQLGVVGGSANAIAPFKRPLSSMTPTIITRDGKVTMILGTPGGSRIPTSLFQVLVNVYDFGMPLTQALAQPRFHHQLLPENTIYSEPYWPFPAKLTADLAARGYSVATQDYNGDVEAIQVVKGRPVAASDPRGRGFSMTIR